MILQDGMKWMDDENRSTITISSVETGWLKNLFKKLKNSKPPNNRKKADQAMDNMDRASETAKQIANQRREREERERREHERRRAHEKAKRDEERMNRRSGSDRNRERNRGGRDRAREKAERDRDRLDRG